MRRLAWVLLWLFAFAVPWEFSLDPGPPWGNIARMAGLALLLVAIPALLQAGRLRKPGPLQWLSLAYVLWLCCSSFWTIELKDTLLEMRAYPQVMLAVWVVWEFADSAWDLRWLLRAFVAGSWVLAGLTVANFASPEALAAGQVRFAAVGQDPNDVARFLVLGLPLAALLLNCETGWRGRMLAMGYFPLGLLGVLLTASREGLLAGLVGLAGSAVILTRLHPRRALAGAMALPAVAVAIWLTVPRATLARLGTIPEELAGGDLNQRLKIWNAGWHAFARAPLLGSGAGTFVSAAGLSSIDTAHNTVLSVVVSGGLLGLFLVSLILVAVCISISETRGALRWAMGTALLVWAVTSLAAAVEESRTTWLLFALIALAGRLAIEDPAGLRSCFPDRGGEREAASASETPPGAMGVAG